MPIIVASDLDAASRNIRKRLISLFGFKEKPAKTRFDGNPVYCSGDILLISSKRELVESDHIEQHFNPDLLVFASRHKSAAGKQALLVHCTGNWTEEVDLGGRPLELAVAPACAMREALLELSRQKSELGLAEYDVSLECTHHGPTSLSAPLLFIELGSNENSWSDESAAEAVAKAIYKVAKGVEKVRAALGIGGPHYAPNFTRAVLSSSEIAVGHIIPNYVLQTLGREMIRRAIERTLEEVKLILLDWKGLRSKERDLVMPLIDELGLEVLRTHEITRGVEENES